MKKLYFLLISLGLLVNCGYAQYQWAKCEGLWAYDYGYGVVTDVSGNVYVAGKYEENAIFSGSSVNCAGNHDIFLVKYTPSGSVSWIRTAGGTMGDYAEAISTDGTNFVYIAGEIEGGGVVNFPPSSTTLQCMGDNDIFIAKYDLNGNLQWAKREGMDQSEKALGVSQDAAGNVYIAGYFTHSTNIGGTLQNSAGYRDIYVAKYNSSGAFQWVRYAGSAGRDEAKAMKVDAAGNVYICGMYSNNCNFGAVTMTCQGSYFESFVAKYSSDGVLQWVRKGGGDYDDVAWSITMDNTGKIYVAGEYNAYALWDGTPLVTSGNADIFVAAYDASGSLQWAKRAGGTLNDRARGIGTDGTTLYITGQFGSNVTFGSSSISAADSSDVFIASLTAAGDFLWGTSIGGIPDSLETLGYESGNAVTGDGSGNIYATGAILDGGSFGNIWLSPYTRTDIFVTKVNTTNIGMADNLNTVAFSIYPNPAKNKLIIKSDLPQLHSTDAVFYNALGQKVLSGQLNLRGETELELDGLEEGVYVIELRSAGSVNRRKLIIGQ